VPKIALTAFAGAAIVQTMKEGVGGHVVLLAAIAVGWIAVGWAARAWLKRRERAGE
jgi:hypothetical protein